MNYVLTVVWLALQLDPSAQDPAALRYVATAAASVTVADPSACEAAAKTIRAGSDPVKVVTFCVPKNCPPVDPAKPFDPADACRVDPVK